MASALTASQENYLEWIFRFSEKGPVHVRDIAHKLGVKLPSVSRAVSALTRAGMVTHESYGTIHLTEQGRAAGRAIVRRDECLTRLLVNVLGMTPEAADSEVNRMEHVVGDDALLRLEALVGALRASEAWRADFEQRLQAVRALWGEPSASPIGGTPVHAGSLYEKAADTAV